MAHWAEIDENNIVLRVTVGSNEDHDEGYQCLIDNLGGRWIKTSYNTKKGIHLLGGNPLRKNYAAIGFIYDENRDAFYSPQPFLSWKLNEESCVWEPPIPYPDENKIYLWDESKKSWIDSTPAS